MPTKERKMKAQSRTDYLAKLDHAADNAPSHLIDRMRKPSVLGTSLYKKRFYKWRGLTFDEFGQPLKPRSVDALQSSNCERYNDKLALIHKLFSDHQELWGKRGGAKVIAYKVGLHADTVRRYIRDFPQGT